MSGGSKRPELACAREGAERIDIGSWRGTGRPDVARVYMRNPSHGPAVLSCREVDLNGDGRKDILVYFDADGRKVREEFDHDYDGVADVKSFYTDGKLSRQEIDVNHDGKADLVQYVENGKVVRTEKLLPEAEAEKPAADKEKAPAEGAKTPTAEPKAPGESLPPPPVLESQPSPPKTGG